MAPSVHDRFVETAPTSRRQRRGTSSFLAIAACVLGACGGGDSTSSASTADDPSPTSAVTGADDDAGSTDDSVPPEGTAEPTRTIDTTFTPPDPDPASAEITLDPATAGSALIGPGGGSIETTASDGRHYRLTVPPGFLPADVEISITPLADVTTEVLEGFAGGVQLAPEGLTFPGVVWLEIAGAGPLDGLVGFSYEHDGEEVSLGWAETDGDIARVAITHFSGAGAGTPAPGAGDRSPSGSLPAIGNALSAAYIANDYQCIDSGGSFGSAVVAWYQAVFTDEIEPVLEAAGADDVVLAEALDAALRWKAAGRLFGYMMCSEAALTDVPEQDAADQLMSAGLVNGIDTAADTCATSHDIGEVSYMLHWAGVAKLLFGDADGGWSSLARERVAGCLTFELSFTSFVEVNDPLGFRFDARMAATITSIVPYAQSDSMSLEPGSETGGWHGGALTYSPHVDAAELFGCEIVLTDISTKPAEAALPTIDIPKPSRQVPTSVADTGSAPADGAATGGSAQDGEQAIRLIVRPLEGSEVIAAACDDRFSGPNPDGAWGPWTFDQLHEDELGLDPDWQEGFAIDLEQGQGQLIGRKTYQRTETHDGTELHEETTLDLFHAAPRVP